MQPLMFLMYSYCVLHLVCLQATATRSQDEQYFSSQQALLQQQLADMRLKADKTRAGNHEASDGLRKNRLKLQQELEVHLGTHDSMVEPCCHSSLVCLLPRI